MNVKTDTTPTLPARSAKPVYEAPELVPIGNLLDVVAGTTQHNTCDSVSHNPGTDGDVPGFSC